MTRFHKFFWLKATVKTSILFKIVKHQYQPAKSFAFASLDLQFDLLRTKLINGVELMNPSPSEPSSKHHVFPFDFLDGVTTSF